MNAIFDRASEISTLNFVSQFNPSKLIMLDGGVDGEMQTGRAIYENLRDKQSFGALKKFGLNRERVNSIKDLKKQLVQILTESEPGVGIILHLEFHGDKNGMEIGNTRQRIAWRDLMKFFSRINERTRCNLGLVMAGCDGFGSFKIERLHDPAPFYFQLSHEGLIFPDQLQASLIKFYDSTFTDQNLTAAAHKARPFKIKFAEDIFARLMYIVCQRESRSKVVNQNVNAVLTGLLARGGLKGDKNLAFNRNLVKSRYGSFADWVRLNITSHLDFFCGREPAFTVEQLTEWIVTGERIK